MRVLRYGIVGLSTNAAGYLIYLLITFFGLSPKVTMTMLYAIGATMGYLGNFRFTFDYRGSHWAGATRFALTYGAGYALNLGLLIVFVDWWHYPHQLVQGVAIFVNAAFLFVALNVFVFPDSKRGENQASSQQPPIR